MPQESQAEKRDELLIELGFLADPIRRLIDSPTYRQELPFVEAQWVREVDGLYMPRLNDFVRESGLSASQEHTNARNAIYNLREAFRRLRDTGDIGSAKAYFLDLLNKAKVAVRSLPCYDAGQILPGLAPLSTYRRLLSLCRAATSCVDFFDPYLDKAVYLLYLDEVEPSVQITVVASEATMRDAARRDRIVAVSELLAVQRPGTYQLRVTAKQHDRHLRTDEQILHLGGSVKDASKAAPYTISNLDDLQSNHTFLDEIIRTATEWFGPGVKKHRQAI